MRHMIIHRSADGGRTYNETDDLDGAIRMVEHLRNTENVADARIFSLHEVPIEFKAYYRVEVTALDESLTMPESLAAPAGLSLRPGGRGQSAGPAPDPAGRVLRRLLRDGHAAR